MAKPLTIEGSAFEKLGVQRGGATVYRGDGAYLRLGAPAAIAKDLSFHKTMEKAGYPVARLLSEGMYKNKAYFIEKSLGQRSFRTVFAEDYRTGVVSDEHFGQFLKLTERFFLAQISTAGEFLDREELARAIRLPLLKTEMRTHADAFDMRFEKAVARLKKYPNVVTHGDLNPSNMYPNGIIDLEDSFMGPLGFDIVSAISTQEWFPDGTSEFPARYHFSDAQKARYSAHFDTLFTRAHAPSLSEGYDDFAFCRAVWLCAGLKKWPKIKKWRTQKLIHEHLS